MSKIKEVYIPLDDATMISRRHRREVDPPGMVDIQNALPSRSDASIAMRPDMSATWDQVYAISSELEIPSTTVLRDAINSVTGMYGSSQLAYFTTFIPYGSDSGELKVLSDTHSDGTVSGTSGLSEVAGAGTKFLEKAHRGAIMRIEGAAQTSLTSYTSYTGAPHLWIESTVDGEWYVAETDTTELAIYGGELAVFAPRGTSGTIVWWSPIASMRARGADIGDGDSLGYDAIYATTTYDASPATKTGIDSLFAQTDSAINISGSNYKWTVSIDGANEYYLTERDGTAPPFVADEPYRDYRDRNRYYVQSGAISDISEQVKRQETYIQNIADGTLSSLADKEWAIGDAISDGLGFDTYYIRNDDGDPDTTRSVKSLQAAVLWGKTDVTAGSYTWTKTSNAPRDETYYLRLGSANPKITEAPSQLLYNNTPLNYVTSLASLGWSSWYYGDLDALGYNTIYYSSPEGDPDLSGVTLEIVSRTVLYSSNYSWTVSGSGTNEYYLEQQDGSTLAASFILPATVSIGDFHSASPQGTLGSLANGEWGFGDNDSIGKDVIYVCWDLGDPDTEELAVIAHYEHSLYASPYLWVASNTSNEYYLTLNDGTTTPDIASSPDNLYIDDILATKETIGSLSAPTTSGTVGGWGYGKLVADSLSFDTIYIYSTTDPNGAVGTGRKDETAPLKVFESDTVVTPAVSDSHYIVNTISDENNLSVLGLLQNSFAGKTPLFYNNHNPFLADYKLNIQGYTSGIIYCGPTINDVINENDICGPFYMGLEPGTGATDPDAVYSVSSWAYDGNIITSDALSGTPTYPLEYQPTFAATDFTYVQVFSEAFEQGGTIPLRPLGPSYLLATSLAGDDAWTTGTVTETNATSDDPFFWRGEELTGSDYKWTASGSGNNEFYCELTGGGNPSLSDPDYLDLNGVSLSQAALGSLTDHTWNYGNNDTLGYNTVYIRDDTGDPDGSGVEIYATDAPVVDYAILALNSIQSVGGVYVCAVTIHTEDRNESLYPGIAYSTNAAGTTWKFAGEHDTYEWGWYPGTLSTSVRADTDNQAICAAWDGVSRFVNLLWRPSDDRITVRYSDDDGVSWSSASIDGGGGTFTGDITCKVRYLNEQFVITKPTGVLYGTGAAFTTQLINGVTAVKDIAYGGVGVWVVIEEDRVGRYSADIDVAGWNEFVLPSSDGEETNFVHYDLDGTRFLVSNKELLFSSYDGGSWSATAITDYGTPGPLSQPSNFDSNRGVSASTLNSGFNADMTNLVLSHAGTYTYWTVTAAVPVVPEGLYRATTFSVLDGYVVLIGTREWTWEYSGNQVNSETIGSTPAVDGIQKAFILDQPANLGDNGIEPDSFEDYITMTDDSTERIYDDGESLIIGSVDATGTIDYRTGVVTLVFGALTIKDGETFTPNYRYLTKSGGFWTHHPRRIRWTAPMTYNDFSGVGSGAADTAGEGMFLDSRPVNGRIVVFETNRVTAIVPRGIVEDPWDYDIIKNDFRIISNPIVVDDMCYVICTDGLLYATNGITVEEAKSSFDITAFDDYTEVKPVSLDYSRALNSLIVYYFNADATTHTAYMISIANGAVTTIDLPEYADSGSISEEPKYITAISNSSDQRIIVSHNPTTAASGTIVSTYLASGDAITGLDNSEDYWYTLFETGEVYPVPEGQKTSLKHFIARTYSDGGDDRPRLAIKYRSLEDTGWKTTGDTVGTATMTTSALTGSGTAWSTAIGADSGASFTLPWQGIQVRLYKDSTLLTVTTDYTISGNDITLLVALTNGQTLYAYSSNYPEVKVVVGDFFESTEGFHRVTAITNATTITLDHYLSSGSETVAHIPSTQLPDGDGEVKMGINGLVEGMRLKLYLIPEYGASDAPSVVKLTGLTIGHIPMGRKILSATGS